MREKGRMGGKAEKGKNSRRLQVRRREKSESKGGKGK